MSDEKRNLATHWISITTAVGLMAAIFGVGTVYGSLKSSSQAIAAEQSEQRAAMKDYISREDLMIIINPLTENSKRMDASIKEISDYILKKK